MSYQGPSDSGPFGSQPSGDAPPPPPAGGYGAPPSGGYAPPGGYPPSPEGYPPSPEGYPPSPGGYPPSPGGYPPPGGYSAPKATNGLAIAALVTGILSLFCMFPLGLVGVGLGIAGLSSAKKNNGSGKGMAIGGIATGAVGILLAIGFVVLVLVSDGSTLDSDPSDGVCNRDRFIEDPDC